METKKKILVGVSSREALENILPVKESKGQLNTGEVRCPLACQCIAGRMHKGDENGETSYRYGRLSFVGKNAVEELFSKYTLVFSDIRTSESQKESGSHFQCPPSCVIVGRHHEGDENAQTWYYYREVWVKKILDPDDNKIRLSNDDPDKKECKESAGIWMQSEYMEDKYTEYRPMTGRRHSGDENGQTYYDFSLLYFETDEKGNIIDPDAKK